MGAVTGPIAMLRSTWSRRGVPPIEPRLEPGPGPLQHAVGSPSVSVEAPEVTVAIASRNRIESLRRTLLALARQRHRGFEVVLVLDGTTDASAEMARGLELPYPLKVVEQERRGLAAARNRGAREAERPVVAFLDDDIEPVAGYLAAHAEAHAASPDPHVALGPFRPVGHPERMWERWVHAWWQDHFRRKERPDHRLTYIDMIDGNSSMPAALLDRFGGFDEAFTGGRRQDWELGMRLLKAGVRLAYYPAAAGLHHMRTSVSGSLRTAREEGHNDVLLGGRHPEALAHLPLAGVADGIVGGSRRLEAVRRLMRAPRGVELLVAALGALEAAHLRGAWLRLAEQAVMAAYAEGVCAAMPDPEERREFLTPLLRRDALPTVTVQLEDPRPVEPPAGGGAFEVVLSRRERAVARVPGTRPAEQWDGQDLVERLVYAATPALALSAAVEPLAGVARAEAERVRA